ncbi:hypothetical protein RFI_04796, partial [Reticulomyxa filosa]
KKKKNWFEILFWLQTIGPFINKSSSLMYKQIRVSFMKAVSDVVAIFLTALLALTVYRILPLLRDSYRLVRVWMRKNRKVIVTENMGEGVTEMKVVPLEPPSLRFGLGLILKQQLRGNIRDILYLVRFLFWSLLIIVTLVRLFEFISELADGGRKRGRSRMTLKLAAKIAQDQAQLIWGDFYQIFTLLFAWKTYKFAIASLVFATLLPAAGFLELFATSFPKVPRLIRQLLAIFLWYVLCVVLCDCIIYFIKIRCWSDDNYIRFGGLIYLLITMLGSNIPKNGSWSTHADTVTTQTILYSMCFVVLAICFASSLALFGFTARNNDPTNSPFRRQDRTGNAPATVHLPRQCSQCQQRLQYGPLPNDRNRYLSNCAFCEKQITSNCHYCVNFTTCDALKKPYCQDCANLLVLDSAKKQEENAPGAVSETSVVLWGFSNDDYTAHYIRITWPNVLAILGVFLEVGVMIALIFSIFYMQSNFTLSTDFSVPTDSSFHTLMHLSRVYLYTYMYMCPYILCVCIID